MTIDIEEFKRKTIEEHLSLGKHKCISYLPLPTIGNVLRITTDAYVLKAKQRDLDCVIFEESQTCIKGGAVYVYSSNHLRSILKKHKNLLEKESWPTNVADFVRRISYEWVDNGHPIKAVIRDAFGDRS